MKTRSKTREATCFWELPFGRLRVTTQPESCQKCVAGAGLLSVGSAAFLHNVIIGH